MKASFRQPVEREVVITMTETQAKMLKDFCGCVWGSNGDFGGNFSYINKKYPNFRKDLSDVLFIELNVLVGE